MVSHSIGCSNYWPNAFSNYYWKKQKKESVVQSQYVYWRMSILLSELAHVIIYYQRYKKKDLLEETAIFVKIIYHLREAEK